VTHLRLSDLPPAMREQAEAKLAAGGGEPIKRATKRGRAENDVAAGGAGRCVTCGERFPNPTAWEHHVDDVVGDDTHAGHARWEIDL
jgi:hypothetical protein